MDKEYIVTLHRKEDLEKFYNEMKLTNFPLVKKRPLSRNTHYMMTEEQAERLRQDPRVWGVEEVDKIIFVTQQNNNEPYNLTGNFWKDDTVPPANVSSLDYQWGHVHCAGDATQRGKNQFGSGSTFEQLNTSIDVFNDGRNVDVVIVDDSVSYDNEEWLSPSTGLSRFVQYQWFNELNGLVSSIDDDGQALPSGTITYDTSANIPQYHGVHVTGTACGQHYGWAREANIYNIAVTSTWPSGQSLGGLLIFDYLRAFHQSKPINPATGRRNPTITNHSYGSIINMPQKGVDPETEQPIYRLDFADVTLVRFRGVIYDANNPNPSGWTEAGLEADCGVRFGLPNYPGYSSAISADIQDAIEEGIVVIGAAGNDNLLMAEVGDQDYDNILGVSGVGNLYYNRGGSPNTPDSGAINVGSLSKQADFRRSTYTQFGPSVDIFAPGDNILSAFSSAGLADGKYSAGNFFYPINGTSMASPQVCGVISCLASNKVRFTQEDARGLLNQFCIRDDMTFDLSGGGLDDNTCRFGSPNRYLHIENPRKSVGYLRDTRGDRTSGMTFPRFSTYYETGAAGGVGGNTYTFSVGNSGASYYTVTGADSTTTHNNAIDPTINCNSGDTLVFQFSISGTHPFWIKTVGTTGTGNAVLGSNAPVWEGIGLEGWTSTHNAPILFTQALDDTTGGNNQVTWMQEFAQAVQSDPNNATATLTTCQSGGHNAFVSDPTLQTAIRNFVGGTNPAGAINNARFTIPPGQGETYVIDGTSYPVMGSLYVPVGLPETIVDAVVVFHGTLSSGTIGQAAEDMLDRFVDTTVTNLNIRDKIVFAVAYPQDHISQSDQYNLSGVGTEQADFLMGDNLPYARAAVEWVKNSLDSFISAQGGNKEVGDVYLFGHSQGGKLVTKINTIDTGLVGVIANAPGPIQFDQTCSADPGNTSCSKVIAIHDAPGSRADQGIMINNGQQTLDLTWDTTGVTPGTYYYICQYHIGMLGEIVIS